MTSEICANCGHERLFHFERRQCNGSICEKIIRWDNKKQENIFCKCKKFKPQNHNPQTEVFPSTVRNQNTTGEESIGDTEPEEDTSKNEVLIKSSGSDDASSLSDKIIEDNEYYKHGWIQIEDVKESVQKLKKHFFFKEDRYFIDKIFGSALI